MDKYLMVFKNNHDAVSAESKLKAKEYEIMVMPTPTQITHSCGICVIFNKDSYKQAEAYIKDNIIYKDIYMITASGLKKMI